MWGFSYDKLQLLILMRIQFGLCRWEFPCGDDGDQNWGPVHETWQASKSQRSMAVFDPLVNVYVTMENQWKDPSFFMGKTTISVVTMERSIICHGKKTLFRLGYVQCRKL